MSRETSGRPPEATIEGGARKKELDSNQQAIEDLQDELEELEDIEPDKSEREELQREINDIREEIEAREQAQPIAELKQEELKLREELESMDYEHDEISKVEEELKKIRSELDKKIENSNLDQDRLERYIKEANSGYLQEGGDQEPEAKAEPASEQTGAEAEKDLDELIEDKEELKQKLENTSRQSEIDNIKSELDKVTNKIISASREEWSANLSEKEQSRLQELINQKEELLDKLEEADRIDSKGETMGIKEIEKRLDKITNEIMEISRGKEAEESEGASAEDLADAVLARADEIQQGLNYEQRSQEELEEIKEKSQKKVQKFQKRIREDGLDQLSEREKNALAQNFAHLREATSHLESEDQKQEGEKIEDELSAEMIADMIEERVKEMRESFDYSDRDTEDLKKMRDRSQKKAVDIQDRGLQNLSDREQNALAQHLAILRETTDILKQREEEEDTTGTTDTGTEGGEGGGRRERLEKLMDEGLKAIDASDLAEKQARFEAQKEVEEERKQEMEGEGTWETIKKTVSFPFKRAAERAGEAQGVVNSFFSGAGGFIEGISKNYQKNKELRESRTQKEDENNIYAGREEDIVDEEDNRKAVKSLMERFDEDFGEAALQEDEYMEVNSERGEALKEDIHDLIADFAVGDMSEAEFLEQKNDIMEEHFGNEDIPPPSVFADNSLEIAKGVRDGIIHLDQVQQMDVTIGEAASKFKREAEEEYGALDKMVDAVQKSKIAEKVPVNAASVVGATAGAAGFLGQRAAYGASSAVGGLVGLGAGVGVGKYFESSKRLKEQQAYVEEAKARGEETVEEEEFREELEQFSLEMLNAENFVDRFQTEYCKDDSFELRGDLSDEELEQVMEQLAEIENRQKFERDENRNMINYQARETEDIHANLMVLKAEIKQGLKEKHNIAPDTIDQTIEHRYQERFLPAYSEYEQELQEHFDSYRRQKALREATAAGTFGMIGGAALAETAELGWEGSNAVSWTSEPETQGVFDFIAGWEQGENQTVAASVLDSMGDWISGAKDSINYLAPDHSQTMQLSGGELNINLPEGFNIQPSSGSHEAELFTPEGDQVPLDFNHKTGALTQKTINRLGSEGIVPQGGMSENVQSIMGGWEMSEVPAADKMDQLSDKMSDVYQLDQSDKIWLGNETPDTYDFNELRSYWGGVSESGFDGQGNIEFKIDMEEFATNAQGEQIAGSQTDFPSDIIGKPNEALSEGRMFLEIRPEEASGAERFQIPFDADGSVEIPKSHPAYDMCFEEGPGGEAVLKADLMEIVEHGSDQAQGDKALIYSSVQGQGTPDSAVSAEMAAETVNSYMNEVTLTEPTAEDGPNVFPAFDIYPHSGEKVGAGIEPERRQREETDDDDEGGGGGGGTTTDGPGPTPPPPTGQEDKLPIKRPTSALTKVEGSPESLPVPKEVMMQAEESEETAVEIYEDQLENSEEFQEAWQYVKEELNLEEDARISDFTLSELEQMKETWLFNNHPDTMEAGADVDIGEFNENFRTVIAVKEEMMEMETVEDIEQERGDRFEELEDILVINEDGEFKEELDEIYDVEMPERGEFGDRFGDMINRSEEWNGNIDSLQTEFAYLQALDMREDSSDGELQEGLEFVLEGGGALAGVKEKIESEVNAISELEDQEQIEQRIEDLKELNKVAAELVLMKERLQQTQEEELEQLRESV
ncbi:MAG: hypothetical protein ABEJ02_00260 [Candidatus Paceibacteria bacterium]